jgi:serine protease Do
MIALGLLSFAGGRLMAAGQQEPTPPPPPGDVAIAQPPQEGQDSGSYVFNFDDGRGWLGASLRDVTSEMAQELKLPGDYGAVVEHVETGSPAAKAGLEAKDVIVEFAGERVWSVAQLARWVRETPPGRTAGLTVVRNGETRKLDVKIENRQRAYAFNMPAMPDVGVMPDIHVNPKIEMPQFDVRIFSHGGVLGISGDDLTSQLASYFGVKGGKGVLVREVIEGSAAAKAGLKAGDVIVKLDGKPVESVVDLRRSIADLPADKAKTSVTIIRNHEEKSLPIEIERRDHGPMQSAEMMEMLDVNPAEWAQLKAAQEEMNSGEVRRQLEDAQVQARKAMEDMQQQVREQLVRNQGAWKVQMEKAREDMRQAQRKYQEEMRKQMLLRDRLTDTTII